MSGSEPPAWPSGEISDSRRMFRVSVVEQTAYVGNERHHSERQARGRDNLPWTMTSFIGRDAEVAAVIDHVGRERLVTLTGAGGCGKTRLALQAATASLARWPGGTWWAELAALADGGMVADHLAGVLGAASAPGGDVAAIVAGHLRDAGACLVVLDNAEHLVEAVAALAHTLLSACPDTTILVTSREPLGVTGELVWRVPSLPVPPEGTEPVAIEAFPSVALFLDRARLVRPNLVVDDRLRELVASVCRRLDGIPLAIELAAARTRTLPIERLSSGLDDMFRLLSGGSRVAMPRQQTLLASIEWSVDLLDERERAVLRRLSVFHGSFEMEAAEVVAADGEVTEYDVLDLLGRLVDKSLVQLDGSTGRYRLLETIRQFALERVRSAGELAAARRRHAIWCAEWSESLGRGEHDLDIGRTHPTLPDVFAALDWAYADDPPTAYRILAGIGWVRHLIGRYADIDRQCDWLAAQDPDHDPAGWAGAVAGLAPAATALARESMVDLLGRAAPWLLPDSGPGRMLRHFSAVAAAFMEHPAELRAIVAEADAAGDDQALRQNASVLAVIENCRGEFDRTADAVERLRRMLTRRSHPFTSAAALAGVAQAALLAALRGDVDEAVRIVDLEGQADSAQVFAIACTTAYVAYLAGDVALARAAVAFQAPAHRALLAYEAQGGQAHLGPIAAGTHGALALLEGRLDDARADLLVAYERAWLSPSVKSYAAALLAGPLLVDGSSGRVEELADEIAADATRHGDAPLAIGRAHVLRALVSRSRGDHERLRAEAHRCLETAHAADARLLALDALELIAEEAHGRGRRSTAARLFAACAAERERSGYRAVAVPDPEQLAAVASELQFDEPDAWAGGLTLAFEDAVAYARRSRGERGRPALGWASLTRTEDRVVALVAAGRSNDEVAAELMIGVATVKTHLTHVYTKLGLRNRAELAAARARRVAES